MALMPYSVSPFLIDQRRGPNPKKYSLTFIPAHLAVTKCPNSCSITMAMRAKITPRKGENPVTMASTRTMATKKARRTKRSRLSIFSGPVGSRFCNSCVKDSPRSLLHRPPRPLTGPPVCFDHNVHSVRRSSVVILQDLTDRLGNRAPRDNTLQECGHRDLVGGVQPRWRGSSRLSGLVGEVEAWEGADVRRLEVETPGLGPVERTEGDAAAVRIRQGVADGKPHVRVRELGNRRPVGELNHRV